MGKKEREKLPVYTDGNDEKDAGIKRARWKEEMCEVQIIRNKCVNRLNLQSIMNASFMGSSREATESIEEKKRA